MTRQQELRKILRTMTTVLVVIAVVALIFTATNVTLFAIQHGITPWIAWLLDPMVGVALGAVLISDGRLSEHGIRSSGWAAALRWFAGLATWTMNCWDSIWPHGQVLSDPEIDPAGMVLHSVPPVLLIVLAEAIAHYRKEILRRIAELDAGDARLTGNAPTSVTQRSALAGNARSDDSAMPVARWTASGQSAGIEESQVNQSELPTGARSGARGEADTSQVLAANAGKHLGNLAARSSETGNRATGADSPQGKHAGKGSPVTIAQGVRTAIGEGLTEADALVERVPALLGWEPKKASVLREFRRQRTADQSSGAMDGGYF